MAPLHEKHRPRTFDAVIGQDKAVATLRRLLDAGLGGQALWITGKTGTGKTTLAYIVAASLADQICVSEYDGNELSAAQVRDLERATAVRGFGPGGRVIIVNEAHRLRRDAITALLVVLERIPSHVTWIFTTTFVGNASLFEDQIDGSPLVARCIPVALSQRMDVAKVIAPYVQRIAVSEGLDGQELGAYVKLVNDCRGSIREALQRVQGGAMIGGGE